MPRRPRSNASPSVPEGGPTKPSGTLVANRSLFVFLMTKLMTQLTSVQLIEAALWRELGYNEPQSADVLHQALADAVSRWLLIRSESPDIDALKFVCRVKANIDQPERLL